MTQLDRASCLGIGIHPQFSSIENPSAGILVCTFNEPMLNDEPLNRITSYVVEPQGDAKPLFITGATAKGETPTFVTLSFVGGGSVYKLTINGVMDPAGNYIDPLYNSQLFELLYPAVDELFNTTDYQFDTNLGVVTMGINTLSERRIEDLAIQRTRNAGHDEQFRLISEALEDAGINRDETKLKLFKG